MGLGMFTNVGRERPSGQTPRSPEVAHLVAMRNDWTGRLTCDAADCGIATVQLAKRSWLERLGTGRALQVRCMATSAKAFASSVVAS
jgi:hypothetical protein